MRTLNLTIIIAAALLAGQAAGQTVLPQRTVMADTDGVITAPANWRSANRLPDLTGANTWAGVNTFSEGLVIPSNEQVSFGPAGQYGWSYNPEGTGQLEIEFPGGTAAMYSTDPGGVPVLNWPGKIIADEMDVGGLTASVLEAINANIDTLEVQAQMPEQTKWSEGLEYASELSAATATSNGIGKIPTPALADGATALWYPRLLQTGIDLGVGAGRVDVPTWEFKSATDTKSALGVTALETRATNIESAATAEASARVAGDAASVATAASDATTKANAAQAAAIAAAATDATTKANAAQAAGATEAATKANAARTGALADVQAASLTLAQSFTGNGIDNRLPNQTADGGSEDDANVMTRVLQLREEALNAGFWAFGNNSSGGNVGTGSSQTRSGSTAGGWGRTIITSTAMRSGSSGGLLLFANCPIIVSVWAAIDVPSTTNGSVTRVLVGDTGNATGVPPRLADQDAFTARGFGAEFYWSTANNRNEVRIIAHNGTTYSVSGGVPFTLSFSGMQQVALSSDGAGNIKLYGYTTGTGFGLPGRLILLASMSGGPSGNNTLGGNHITAVAANHSTVAPSSGDAFFNVTRSKFVIGTSL